MTTQTSPIVGERIVALISTIVLVRHGKAPKTNPEQKDEERSLNELGITQAKMLYEKIGSIGFDKVVSSPLDRAVKTLKIATSSRYPIATYQELTCAVGDGNPIDVMFNKLGYSPLEKYFEHPLGEHLKVWGQTALAVVLNHLGDTPNQVILVGGHAVLQNALVWALLDELEKIAVPFGINSSGVAKKMVLYTPLGEGEAFGIEIQYHKATGVNVNIKHIKLD